MELKGDVDNEALVRGNENCQVLLRVSAMLNEIPFPNSLLQDVSITLSTKDMDDNIESEVSVKPVLKDDAEGLVVPLRISKPIQSVKASMTASIVTNNGVKKQLSASLNLYSTEYNPKRNLNIEEINKAFLLSVQKENLAGSGVLCVCVRSCRRTVSQSQSAYEYETEPPLQHIDLPILARNRREGRGFAGISPESM